MVGKIYGKDVFCLKWKSDEVMDDDIGGDEGNESKDLLVQG